MNVVFEDNTTNAMGVLNKGLQSFPLNGHTSYSIYVRKIGDGTPALITADTDRFAIWNSPRGVDVNKNPKIGHLFGRTYVGNSAVGGTAPNNKGIGLYALNADLTDSPLGFGATATASSLWAASGGNGPWRLRVAPDNTIYVCDFATDKVLWQFAPDLNSSNAVITGTQDYFGTPFVTGSIATGDLVVWTTDGGIPAPATAVLGPNTSVGSYNCVFRYDIGSGPLPWTNAPNFAYTVGLDSIAGLRVEGDLGADGKIIAGFGRANYSNGNIQILHPTGTTLLYNSLRNGTDIFNGTANGGAAVGTYGGVRVSPDGRFIASISLQNRITIAVLTNGIPDESSVYSIANTPTTGNARGICWDAANNITVCSSGQALLRGYSLGLSTTAVTRNDSTGTNGSFELILPAINASVLATTPLASQNYINNTTPGTPIPGVFTVSLATNFLEAPVTVTFNLSGTAVLNSNFTINTGTTPSGVIITTNSVTFPVGNAPGGGDWAQAINIAPTATPVSGPTLTTTLRLNGGANYVATVPVVASVSIANTGPQALVLSASATGTTMNRGIPGDYARFVITRHGDTNGPGNSPGNVVPTSYTLNSFTFGGTAAPFPTDYTAGAQNLPVSGVPVDGTPGIVISPGQVVFTSIIGNPVLHANLNVPPTNVTITVSLTNSVTGTNLVSQDGHPYTVGTSAVTLTELDNTVGPEVVVWSNPLTNAADSVNWTLTFASTNLGVTTVPPVVIPNYDQNALPGSINGGGSNNFEVTFGSPVASFGVPASPVMTANGWDKALRMTVNKDFTFGAPAGVNIYPQGQIFRGNYALRFNMYLSFYSGNIDNSVANTFGTEFALFGINHNGTNTNWKPTTPVTPASGGSGMTNSDGIWMAVNAGAGSVSPADYDGFAPFPLPNNGIPGSGVANGEPVSATAASQAGVFKRPPFVGADTAAHRNGGTPINKWVDVSVEVTKQTNISLFIARSPVLASYAGTNGFTDGPFMLGYLDPISDVSDPASAFVYYSNVRVVELSPYITNQPISLIVTQGANVVFNSAAAYENGADYQSMVQWHDGTCDSLGDRHGKRHFHCQLAGSSQRQHEPGNQLLCSI